MSDLSMNVAALRAFLSQHRIKFKPQIPAYEITNPNGVLAGTRFFVGIAEYESQNSPESRASRELQVRRLEGRHLQSFDFILHSMDNWHFRSEQDENSTFRINMRNLENSLKMKYEEPQIHSLINSRTFRDLYIPFPTAYEAERSQPYRQAQADYQNVAEQKEPEIVQLELKEEDQSCNQDLQQRKGLRYLALRVSQLLRSLQSATYRQVSNMLVEQLVPPKMSHSSRQKEQKNIKRRVYDALNVLISVGVIEKKSKRISIREQLSVGKCLTSNSWDTLKTMQKKEDDLNRSLHYRLTHLKNVARKYLALRKLKEKNRLEGFRADSISFPMVVVRTPGKEVKLYESKCRKSLAVCSTNKITIRGDFDIIRETVPVDETELEELMEQLGWIL